MNFKIVRFNEMNKTMVIDWGDNVILNHYIPPAILENPDISKERTIEIIESMRPEVPEPVDLPMGLRKLYEESNNVYDTGTGEDII